MKKNSILLCLTMLYSISTLAQNKEIDRLYNLYKNDSTITIYSTFGEIEANVYVKKNSDNKPESITLCGGSYDYDGIIEIVTNLINQKIKQNYIRTSGNSFKDIDIKGKLEQQKKIKDIQATNTAATSLDNSGFKAVFKKGEEYFIVTIDYYVYYTEQVRDYSINSYGIPRSLPPKIKRSGYNFTLENGDNSRKGGTKARTFDF